jgi:predicted nucleic acid-binding protein
MVESIYVDSNAFIPPVIGENSKRANGATSLLRMIEAERVEAFTSVLSWDEVRWIFTKVLGKADGAAAGRKLLGFPHLHPVEANSAVMSAAQSLLERYSLRGLGPRDAIHCASAVTRKTASIASDDGGLDFVKEVKRIPLARYLESAPQESD